MHIYTVEYVESSTKCAYMWSAFDDAIPTISSKMLSVRAEVYR